MTMKSIVLLSCLLLTMSNCKKDDSMKDPLSISKTDYHGNQLRIDGYYYKVFEGKIIGITFFYRDGVVLDCGGSKEDFAKADEHISTQFLINEVHKGRKTGWGLFIIDNNTITYEQWHYGHTPYKSRMRIGDIVNDSMFVINEYYLMKDGKKAEFKEINETYYFREFSPKPDSTNTFIK
jgi:hypothetical protein